MQDSTHFFKRLIQSDCIKFKAATFPPFFKQCSLTKQLFGGIIIYNFYIFFNSMHVNDHKIQEMGVKKCN